MTYKIPTNSKEHNDYALNYLSNFTLNNKIMSEKYNSYTNSNNNTKIAIIIEPRSLDILEPIIRNVNYFLNQHQDLKEKNTWNIRVYHGVDNFEFIKNKLPNFNISYVNLGVDNITADEHNLLLRSSIFWNSIEDFYTNVLIFQTDSCMLRTLDEKFLDYDFCGANILNPNCKTPNNIGMNGGFSLRKRANSKKAVECVSFNMVSQYRKEKNLGIFNPIKILAEDIYFWHALEIIGGKLLEKEKTFDFSIETLPDFNIDLNTIKPVGIHGFNKDLIPLEMTKKVFSEAELPK